MEVAMSDLPANNQAIESREPVRFLVFSASLRTASLNSQLAKLAAKIIEQHGGEVDLAEMADFEVPSYDQDSRVEE
jgi:chromate reductase, NAD(P)H dehydrogenase (quinone)